MKEYLYRFYGLIHLLAKTFFSKNRLSYGKLLPSIIKKGIGDEMSQKIWESFILSAAVPKENEFYGTYYAGYIAESKEWCLPSWIWTNASIVRMLCTKDCIIDGVELGNIIARKQQDCGGWIVRHDYDKKGAIPVLAPNDSSYIANNAFVTLYCCTRDERWLNIAKKCADWIIETARQDGLVYTGYNIRDQKWNKETIIVDTGFTGGLFANLFEITGEKKYSSFLQSFIKRYIELFYIPEKKGFCTSLGIDDRRQGGMFARGQAWALEGLIPAYKVLKDEKVKQCIENTIDNLLEQQCDNGGWPYNLTRKMMGEDCKAVPVIAKDMMDWYAISKDERILKSAKKSIEWCYKHTAIEGEAKGGIFSYCTEGAIVKDLYTSCAFVYASAYAIELQKQIKDADNNSN